MQRKTGILDCIGNTPLIPLNRIFPGAKIRLYAKLEMCNPGGSIKDRTAYNIISRALENGKIYKNTTIIESTSGNMGIGLARICHYYGLKLVLVTDPHMNPQVEKILRVFGAEIIKILQHDGKGGYLNTRLVKVREILEKIPDSFWPDQYHNIDSPQAHEKTFQEIVHDLERPPDYIFTATSTCGTLRGLADAIAKYRTDTKIIAVDAVGSVVFGDIPKPRQIPGMGSSRPSHFLKKEQVHDIIRISDPECIEGCQNLLDKESILAGGSSGAVIKAIEKNLSSLGQDTMVVAILVDNGEHYLDTLYSDNWISEHFYHTQK